MAKGKKKNTNKPWKGPPRGPTQPPNRLPKPAPPSPYQGPSPNRHAVLSTYELLEAILLHLDMQTLLVSAQRVNTHWHTLITTSLPLQRHLFFRPAANTPQAKTTLPPTPRAPFVQNPLLKAAFPCFFHLAREGSVNPSWRADVPLLPWDGGFVAARRQSSSSSSAGTPDPDPDPDQDSDTVEQQQQQQRLRLVGMRDGGPEPNRPFVRRGASWRRMLVSQPPPVVVGRLGSPTDLERGPAGGRGGFLVDVGSESGGLRMGELYDAVYAGNWRRSGERGGVDENFGLWVAWRVPSEMACRPAEAPEVPDGWDWSSVAWLAAADLVIGELDWDLSDACSTHCYGSECYLFQDRKAQRIRYRCEEYKPGNRLFLPRPGMADRTQSHPPVPVGSRFWR